MFLQKIKDVYLKRCQKVGTLLKNPTPAQRSSFMFCLGVTLVTLGSVDVASAAVGAQEQFTIQDSKFLAVICAITNFLEGAFGALIMIIAGIGAIISSAFGQYKAAIGLLVVAVGAFVLRSLTETFFGEEIYESCNIDRGGLAGQ